MRRAFVTASLTFMALGCSGVPGLVGSNFEGDDEGWTLAGNGDATAPTLERSGGNPNGCICGTDAKDGDIWYFVAPLKFTGNREAAWNLRLTFDLKQGSIYNQIHGRDVVLNGGGLALSYSARATPGMDWTPYSVRLTPASWVLDATNEPATEEDLRTVLKSLTAVRIRGEYYDGPADTACLDNVSLGVE